MEGFFTWEYLATSAGATLMVTMVTQFVKQIEWAWLKKIPVQVIAYVVALVGIILGTHFTVGLTAESVCIAFVNAIVVTVAANGTYDNIVELLAKKQESSKK